MKFIAEIKQVKATKTASNDRMFTVTFTSEDPRVLELGGTDPNARLEVEVK